MNRSGWHILRIYLLLSAAIYLSLAILWVDTNHELIGLALRAGGNLLAQALFVALMGPSRYLVPIPPWRLVLGSVYAGGLLAVQAVVVLVTLGTVVVSSLDVSGLWAVLLVGGLAGPPPVVYAWCRQADRLEVLKRMGLAVGTGALACLGSAALVFLFLASERSRHHSHMSVIVLTFW